MKKLRFPPLLPSLRGACAKKDTPTYAAYPPISGQVFIGSGAFRPIGQEFRVFCASCP